MERAFLAMYDVKPLERKLMKAAKDGKVARKGLLHDRLQQAFEADVLTEQEIDQIMAADKLRYKAIQVDHFSHDFSEVRTNAPSKKSHLNSAA
jgi:hypothetical protein